MCRFSLRLKVNLLVRQVWTLEYTMRFLITLSLSLVFFTVPLLNAEQSAFDVFIESCRNCGENVNLIQSGYAEFDCTTNRQYPRQKIQDIVRGFEEDMMKVDLGKFPPDIANEIVKSNRENLQRLSRELAGSDDSKYRYKLLFIGNDVFFAPNADVCKRYRVIEDYDATRAIWQLHEFAIMDGSPNAESRFTSFIPGTREATVEAKIQPGYEFQRFGRMQRSETYYIMLQCMGNQDRKKFQITDKAVETFKKKMEEKRYSFETAEKASYVGNETATVIEIKYEGRIVERFWIDTSRGYICPLIQCFDKDSKMEREAKSSGYFLHDKTGLWYPERYEETRISPTGTTVTVYTLNRETFQLNHAVSEKMFTLDIPEGTKVIDKRNGEKEIKYTAMDKGELSLAKGGLNLDKMKWLMREGDLNYGKAETSATAQWFRNITLPLGIFLILLALYMQYRQWRKQKK